jgi:hypothetical protein
MPAIMVVKDWTIYARLMKAKVVIRGFSEFKTEKSILFSV